MVKRNTMSENSNAHTHRNTMSENSNAQKPVRTDEDQAWLRVIELTSMSVLPAALGAAFKLNVMNILANHGSGTQELSAAQIVSFMDSSPRCNPISASALLDRILRLLASHGVLSSSLDTSVDGGGLRKYGLNSVSKYFVEDEDGGASLAPFLIWGTGKEHMETLHQWDEAVLDGGYPFRKAHGKETFLYCQENPRFGQLFYSAMASHTTLLMESLLETYKGFDGVNTIVDVGGGFGASLSMIISKHPHVKGINFDLPSVVAAAPEFPGVEHVGGDMFERVPEAEAIFMKWILHDWSDENCVKILKNCLEALPASAGKVIVVEAILPPAVETGLSDRVAYHMDLLMFTYFQGARERTEEELRFLSKAAGFAHMQIIANFKGTSVVEFLKA